MMMMMIVIIIIIIIIIIMFTEVRVLILLTAVKSDALTLTHVIPSQGRGDVTAVTSLGNEVFVLREDSQQQVEVYDASTFTLQRYITVSGLDDCSYTLGSRSRGLAACAHYKCLYVSDYIDNIHRAELSGSNAVKKWSVGRSPGSLSVNKEHNVVVACWWAHKIQEYTTHGALVREISLQQAGVMYPWHAVQLSTGDYVVSGWKSTGGAVSVVGIDGRVVRHYCPSPSSDLGEMKDPTGLAVTKNDDILVADADNKRILLVNSSLSSARKLALPVDDGIQWTWGLCLDESRGRIYVGEHGGNYRVLVFDGVRL